MGHSIRTAVSLTKKDFNYLEALRKKLDKSRSQLFQEALHDFFNKFETAKLDKLYVEGYRRKPENAKESEVWAQLAAEAFKAEDLK